jgi:hypothetical protein
VVHFEVAGDSEECHHTAVKAEGPEDRGMSAPTRIEREHYAKLVGRLITAILWEKLENQTLPVLLLDRWDREGNAATLRLTPDAMALAYKGLKPSVRQFPNYPTDFGQCHITTKYRPSSLTSTGV